VPKAFAAITLKNNCSNTSGGASGTTLGCSLGTVTAGDLIVVMVDGYSSPTSTATISDKGGDSFTQGTYATSSGLGMEQTFYSANVAGGSSYQVTSTWNPTITYRYISAFEFSGAATSSPLDATGTYYANSSAAGPYATSNGTTTQANDLIVGISNCNDSPGVVTQGTGYTIYNTSGGQCDISEASTSVGAAGSHNAPFNISNSSDHVEAAMEAFKAAPASQPTSTPDALFFAGD
jgi:hypothetical protein